MHLETPGEKVLMGLVRTAKGGAHLRLHGISNQKVQKRFTRRRKHLTCEKQTANAFVENNAPTFSAWRANRLHQSLSTFFLSGIS